MHKYLKKAFFQKMNKKEYKLQICQNSICHINIIVMNNVIIYSLKPVQLEILNIYIKTILTNSFVEFSKSLIYTSIIFFKKT